MNNYKASGKRLNRIILNKTEHDGIWAVFYELLSHDEHINMSHCIVFMIS